MNQSKSGGWHSVKNDRRFRTPMLRPDLRDFSDVHIVLKGEINFKDNDNVNRGNENILQK